jgi:alpha-mannosidase/mannosylglycerate hydrolase
VRTVVENTIRDHRLRVLLPAGVEAESYIADSAFDVVERPIALRADNARYRELEVETKPQYTWTAAIDQSGRRRGLAVVSTGLPESAVCDRPGRTIALTLFRSFIKAFLTDGNEGGQMQGTHEFEYLIVPLDGAWHGHPAREGPPPRTRLCRLGQRLAARPRAVQVEPRDLIDAPVPSLPPSQSFLKLEPGVAVVTAIHRMRGRDGLVMRMFNPTDGPIHETLERSTPIRRVERTDLEGNVIGQVESSDGRAIVHLAPRQIITLNIE